jgi:hypothetical protein
LAVTVIVAVPLAVFEQLPMATFVNVYVYVPGVDVDTGSVTELLDEVVDSVKLPLVKLPPPKSNKLM